MKTIPTELQRKTIKAVSKCENVMEGNVCFLKAVKAAKKERNIHFHFEERKIMKFH